MKRIAAVPLAWAVLALAGCSNDEGLVPVSGTVTLDGKPLAGAEVTFIPAEDTKGPGGIAGTLPDGSYTLLNPQGKKGAVPGKYRVTVSHADVKKFEKAEDAVLVDTTRKEKLSKQYSDPEKTTLTATVEAGGGTLDFPLTSGK